MRTSSFLGPMWSIMVVLILCTITSVNSYSKYGRGCVDIGCLPNEVCVLSHDSCGFGQRDGKECGSYPTCKKSGAAPANSGAFQQFPQPNHPGSGLSPAFPQNIQPVNPYNPPFIFGQQPFFNPGGTGGPPGSLAPGGGGGSGGIGLGGLGLGGYNNPNMFNKPPPQYLPNQNPYNRQTQSHPSSAAGGVHHGTTSSGIFVVVVGGLLSLSSVGGGLSMVTDGFVLGLAMLQQRMANLIRT